MNPPPLLVSFAEPKYLAWAISPAKIETQSSEAIDELVKRGLPPCLDAVSLAVLFGYSTRFVMSLANKPRRHYREFTVQAGKKVRRISSPRVGLKVIQSWFGHHLARAIAYSECVHGFVPGKSTVTAARRHLASKWILSVDIRDFFPSTSVSKVKETLRKVGYSPRACDVLTSLLTLNGGLPQGSPSSPPIANLAFASVDEALEAMASKLEVVYTRYADDLVFSGAVQMPDSLLSTVREIVTGDGWTIADEKTSVQQVPFP